MTMNLVEGQNFSANYVLLNKISENEFVDCWLARDTTANEKIVLKVFKTSSSDEEKKHIQDAISRQKNLQYSFIVRSLEFGIVEDNIFITSPYLQNAEAYLQEGTFAQQWRLLRQVAKALEVAHSIGFAHGHIHPNNILVTDDGNVYITDFGLSQSRSSSVLDYLSPQVKDGQPATPSDDVYSFGQLIHVALTGGPATQSLSTQLPPALEQVLKAMLHTSPMERPTGIAKTIELVDSFVAQINSDASTTAAQTLKAEVVSEPSHLLPREQNTVSTPLVLGGMALLIMIAVGIFVLLPDAEPVIVPSTAIEPAKVEKTQAIEEERLAPFEIAKLKELEEQGEKLATRLLRLQLEVEDLGGQVWASDDYNKSVELGISGDDAYREQSFKLAFKRYQLGIELLENTLNSVDEVYSQNALEGQTALKSGNTLDAIKAFTILNLIKPSNSKILADLSRAENLEKVQSLILDGEIHERNDELTIALARFKEAHKIDKDWLAASEALSRIQIKVANQSFNHEMSLAFSALNKGDFDSAKFSFAKAQKLLPESSAPKDGLEQISIAEIQAKIDGHTKAAHQFSIQEEWIQSSIEHEAILLIASGTTLASEGLARSKLRHELELQLNKFISEPEIMVTDDSLNEAKAVLIKAFRIETAGPKLKDQISRLSHLVSLARIPINVELVSDNKTEVTVYQIRALGQLDTLMLPLYPGTYTIVGKRRGYRDIHKQITLQGGHPAPSIMISCVERI
ncbi:MAG: serine/threonine protein kinase [Candidatus Azotimanducaceae bacterium]|jgi:serine/threonine protein kinase